MKDYIKQRVMLTDPHLALRAADAVRCAGLPHAVLSVVIDILHSVTAFTDLARYYYFIIFGPLPN